MLHRRKTVKALILAAALAGCGDPAGPATAAFGGVWVGTVPSRLTRPAMRVQLVVLYERDDDSILTVRAKVATGDATLSDCEDGLGSLFSNGGALLGVPGCPALPGVAEHYVFTFDPVSRSQTISARIDGGIYSSVPFTLTRP